MRLTIALAGNPNTGKSTLFNALTGLRQQIANYPGVTVERKEGALRGNPDVRLVDLPGIYSLSARSPDEAIALDVLLGRREGSARPDALVAVVDACALDRNLYLLSQMAELGIPLLVALNRIDRARARRIDIDIPALSRRLGAPVFPVCASSGDGIEPLQKALAAALPPPPPPPVRLPTALADAAACLGTACLGAERIAPAEQLRLLIDEGGEFERRMTAPGGPLSAEDLGRARAAARAATGSALPLSAAEAQARYAWARETVAACVRRPPGSGDPASDRIDTVVAHRIAGPLLLVAIMALIFQALYAWSAPLMNAVESLVRLLGGTVSSLLPPGALRSLAVDGVVAGVGGVIVFVPQIAMLFLFLAVLEDCGYMARAAFLADRLLSFCGLSGRSFLPLVSSYACAVPGVMATRTIENPRERLATILVAPLMSCSARLPVYTILIAAFIAPGRMLGGWLDRQGTTLFLFHFVGLAVAVPVAWTFKKTLLRGEQIPSVLELPSYHWPRPRTVLLRVWSEVREFLSRAGTIILATSVVLWGLAYFPHPAAIADEHDRLREEATRDATAVEPLDERLARIDGMEAGVYLRQSLIGRTGRALEGAVTPLGWDWRIGMAAVASFPAREVVIACLGTIFNVGSGHNEASPTLRDALRDARRPDGRPLFDAAVALSVMVFFALCAQCASTLAVIRRETGTWRWAAFTFFYMTALAYIGALATYQGARALGMGGA